jgi:hypothetical protein
MIETHRDPKDGTITAWAKDFTVIVTEENVRILAGDVVVHEWKPGQKNEDAPSPRSRSDRKRGSR